MVFFWLMDDIGIIDNRDFFSLFSHLTCSVDAAVIDDMNMSARPLFLSYSVKKREVCKLICIVVILCQILCVFRFISLIYTLL
jgi:hypothetical protein